MNKKAGSRMSGNQASGLISAKILSGLLSFLLVLAMALTGLPGNLLGIVQETQAATTLSDPKIVSDSSMTAKQKVTWDCIWFGSYPQTEIVDKAETSGCYGKSWSVSSDYEVNESLYNTLENASGWDSNGDITIAEGKYRRIKAGDAAVSYPGKTYDRCFDWTDSDTYHYFRYDKIKWRVLKLSGSSAFLVADKALNSQKYNEEDINVTWAASTIRTWLNNTFLDSAFSSSEQGAIQTTSVENIDNTLWKTIGEANTSDRVFLLSETEIGTDAAKSYGFGSGSILDFQTNDEARRCKSSTYAKAMGSSTYMDNCEWWLRSLRSVSNDLIFAAKVSYQGAANGSGRVTNLGDVRPALNLDLSSSNLWSYAGTVCSNGTVEEKCYEHSYGDWEITKEASCTEKGTKEKTCSVCGDKVTEEIEITDHIWNEDYAVDKVATCSEEGSESIHCSVCGAIKEGSERVIPKLDHQYGEWKTTKVATCTEKGMKEKTCSVCGDKVTEEIEATGHTWNEEYTVDKVATCSEEGSESIHCTVCGAIKEGSEKTIEKVDHNYSDWKTTREASCTEKGTKEKTCLVCGDKVTEEIEATDHTWNEDYTVDKVASCTEEGSESIHCSVCGAIKEGSEKTIEKDDHNYSDWKTTKEASCTEKGTKEKICSVCGDKVTEAIPALGHTVVIDPAVPATTTSTGLTEGSHCSVCNAIIKAQEVIPKKEAKGDVSDTTSVAAEEKKVTENKNDGDIKGSTFNLLQLRAKKVGKTSITLSLTKVKGASGYIIYGNQCNAGGKKYQFKQLVDTTKTTFTQKKLKKGTYYKYTAIAYQTTADGQKILASSKTIHVATTGGKVGNYKSVKLNKKSVTIKKGKTFKIKATQVKASKKLKVQKHRGLAYESSNTKIATVSKAGKITAKKKGSCIVYVYTQSGTFAKISVKVK